MLKEWRNDEAHISPTASEQEIDAAIKIVITMYFFATGSCLIPLYSHSSRSYTLHTVYPAGDEEMLKMVADSSTPITKSAYTKRPEGN